MHLYLFYAIISLLFFIFSLNEGFFWDNIIFGYEMGTHLYENGLFNFNFPDVFDPGHPPFLAFILALGWKLLGKSLIVGHIVLLPFVYGLLIQLHIFVKQYTNNSISLIAGLILLLADPTLLAQFFLISPEIIQLFFFFLIINSILKNKYLFKLIGLAFLGIVTYRGMLLCIGIFIFDILRHIWIQKKDLLSFFTKNNILSYILGSIPAISFICYRLIVKGWLQTHPNSPWENFWYFVNINELLRNLIVLCHRYADFGRIGILLFIFFIIIKDKKKLLENQNKELLLLGITSVIGIIIISLLSVNPFGHRYFIVSYIAFCLLGYRLLQSVHKNRKILFSILLVCLISGNFWIYPEKIAQGWDASLAHIPYFKLRLQAIQYLDSKNIPIEDVVTFFPNNNKIDAVDLCGDLRSFKSSFTGNESYVFYSNIYNLDDNNYDLLKENYLLIKSFQSGQIKIEILKHI